MSPAALIARPQQWPADRTHPAADRQLRVHFAQSPTIYVENLASELEDRENPMGLEADEREWLLEALPSEEAQNEGFGPRMVAVKAKVHYVDCNKVVNSGTTSKQSVQTQDENMPARPNGQQSCISEALWSNRLLALARRHLSGSFWRFSSSSSA